MSKIKYHRTAGCFIIKKFNNVVKLLLIKCVWEDGSSGWISPKGHIERGESPEQAATREAREETGYKNIRILKKLDEINIEFISKSDNFLHKKSILWYLAELVNDDRELSELEKKNSSIVDMRWFNLSEAYNMIPFKKEKEIVRKLKNIFKFSFALLCIYSVMS